jgi:hypothetical protein
MNIAARLTEALQPDREIQITRAVAEAIECPNWMHKSNGCDGPNGCHCRKAAERVAKIVSR